MIQWSAYARLMRLDKPVGILLLWYPTAWGLWMANKGLPPLKLVILFFTGTLLMRSAGCVINDIADREFDKHVARTRSRPLTAGELSLSQALKLLCLLLSCALAVSVSLPFDCFYLAIVSVLVTFIYPFCKRFISAPQLVLGVAFSMGIPMAYIASGVPLDGDLVLLFALNFSWIVAYDTMYAMTDKEDDLKIGVKSTAIYFANQDRHIIGTLQFFLHGLWLWWAIKSQVDMKFYGLWVLGAFILLYQQRLINKRIPQQCFKAFLVSAYYGLCMWVALAMSL